MRWIDEGMCPRPYGWDGPCPWFWCKNHLWIEAATRNRGTSTVIDDTIDPLEVFPCCVIDIALAGPTTLEETAAHLGGLTRERVRQIEEVLLPKVRIQLHKNGMTREIVNEAMGELDAMRASRDWTMSSDPELDGRVSGEDFGKLVSQAQARIVPEKSRGYKKDFGNLGSTERAPPFRINERGNDENDK